MNFLLSVGLLLFFSLKVFINHVAISDIVVPKDNQLRQINELVDFTFVDEEL